MDSRASQDTVTSLVVRAIVSMTPAQLEHVCRLDMYVDGDVCCAVVRVNNYVRDLMLDARPNRYPIELLDSTQDIWDKLKALSVFKLGFTELNTVVQNGGLDNPHVQVNYSSLSDEMIQGVDAEIFALDHPILQNTRKTSLFVPPSNFWKVHQNSASCSALDQWGRVLEQHRLDKGPRIMIFHVPLNVSIGHWGQLATANIGWNCLPQHATLADFEWFMAAINKAVPYHTF